MAGRGAVCVAGSGAWGGVCGRTWGGVCGRTWGGVCGGTWQDVGRCVRQDVGRCVWRDGYRLGCVTVCPLSGGHGGGLVSASQKSAGISKMALSSAHENKFAFIEMTGTRGSASDDEVSEIHSINDRRRRKNTPKKLMYTMQQKALSL